MLRTALRPRALFSVRLLAKRGVSSIPMVQIDGGTFYKQYPTEENADSNPPLFPDLSLTIPSNQPLPTVEGQRGPYPQYWAVIGPSEKTDLLHILRGQHVCVPPNARSYPYLLTDEIAAKDPRKRLVGNAVHYMGFSGEGSSSIGGTRGAYLSARYESHREETDWTVEQFLRGQTSLNPVEGEEHGTLHNEEHLREVVTDLRLTDLLNMPIANLSNGQTRRARIAKALLRKPELLLLDDPFMGLDPPAVHALSELLRQLARECSPRLVLALRPQDTVPTWITHLALIGKSHQIVKQGLRKTVQRDLEAWKYVAEKKPPNSVPKTWKDPAQEARNLITSGSLDEQLLRDFTGVENVLHRKFHPHPMGGETLIEMEGVRVEYNGKVVLGGWTQKVDNEMKEGLHWKLRRGQRWAILGANGSGKTTLLSLITSDHPQSYALPIKFFGRSRLPEAGNPGMSLFELQSRLGHSSPELHAVFPRQLTLRQTLESAFADTYLSKPMLNCERDLDVNALLRAFKPELDPQFAKQSNNKVEDETQAYNKLFPDLPRHASIQSIHQHESQYLDHTEVDYADEILFGELSISQQRIALFLRALVHRPEIVILDEPFSGLTASEREKCHLFLKQGELKFKRLSKNTKSTQNTSRYQGLSEDQALVMISHVKEDIPDLVRHWMRLPSGASEGTEPLEFCFGSLKNTTRLSESKTWDLVWSPLSVIKKRARSPRTDDESPEKKDMQNSDWRLI